MINIIGRNSYNLRSNLWYDYNQRIIYHSGHAVVILRSEDEKYEREISIYENGK